MTSIMKRPHRQLCLVLFLTATLALQGPSGPKVAQAASDVFSDTLLGSSLNSTYWTSSMLGGAHGIVQPEADGVHLRLLGNNSGSFFGIRVGFLPSISGDFDVSVAYRVLTWPNQSGARLGIAAGADLSAGTVGYVERVSFGANEWTHDERYVTDFRYVGQGPAGFIATSDTAGRLRLTRSGSAYAGYWWTGSAWSLINSFNGAISGDVRDLALQLWSDTPDWSGQDVEIAFSGFEIAKGTLSTSQAPSGSVKLAPYIPSRPVGNVGETFYTNQIQINYQGGPVILSGDPPPTNLFAVDDGATLSVTRPDGTTASWSHDFSNGCNGTGITAINPVDIRNLFQVGSNTVAVRLYDLCGFDEGTANAIYISLFGAQITLNPISGAPGSTIKISGQGFAPDQPITLKLGQTTIPSEGLVTDGNGDFTILQFPVPVFSPDTLTLTATDQAGDSAASTFTVTSADPCIQPPESPSGPSVDLWATSAAGATADEDSGLRLGLWHDATAFAGSAIRCTTTINVDETASGATGQRIDGFGAALTDSSAYLIQRVQATGADPSLLAHLFDRDQGIGISYLRLPIGPSDFSYYYRAQDTVDLASLIQHEQAHVEPLVKQAVQINPTLKLMATPWSAPPSLKGCNNGWTGGDLLTDQYGAYAEYLVGFLQYYEREGLHIDAVTPQNEPHNLNNTPSMFMSPAQEADFIANYLGPKIRAAKLTTKILVWDHNWNDDNAPNDPCPTPAPGPSPVPSSSTDLSTFYPVVVANDPAARPYVSGVAFHCYGPNSSPTVQLPVQATTQRDIYFTECSGGEWPNGTTLENVLWSPLSAVQNGARIALLWNLALDQGHGPVFAGDEQNTSICNPPDKEHISVCRGLVTVTTPAGTVRLNQDYYAIGHLSKFVQPGAIYVRPQNAGNALLADAFLNPDGTRVLVVLSESKTVIVPFTVIWQGKSFSYALPPEAAVTFRWSGDGLAGIGAASGSSIDPQGTASASTGGTGPGTPGSMSVTAQGAGTITVARYVANPVGAPTFPSTGAYDDVKVAPGSAFTGLSILDCDLDGGEVVDWWDGASWRRASSQRYDQNTRCVTVTVDATTAPTVTQLTGTVFGADLSMAVAPTTAATVTPVPNASGWNDGPVAVALTAADVGGPGVRSITSGASGAQSLPSTTVAGASATINIAADGVTTITFFATDNVGNQEAPKTLTVKLDKTAPVITVGGVQAGATYTNSATPTVSIADPNGADGAAGSGIDATKTVITLDGQPYTSGTPVTGPGAHTLAVSAADVAGNTASQTVSFTVVHATSLAITSSPTQPTGAVTLTAKLTDTAPSGAVVPTGLPVAFTVAGQTATGITNASGIATVTLTLGVGKDSVTAIFGGQDASGHPTFYLPSSATAQTLYVYQPTTFVIWGGNPPIPSGQPANVTLGQDYTFWGAQWAKQVAGGDFQANSSFKGYANSVSGTTWTADPGNASGPPASVASYIGVIVATRATRQGSVESGNVAETVVLQVDNPAAYQPDPGHPGTGVMVAVVQ